MSAEARPGTKGRSVVPLLAHVHFLLCLCFCCSAGTGGKAIPGDIAAIDSISFQTNARCNTHTHADKCTAAVCYYK